MCFVDVTTVDSSATETEDETKHNGLLQQKKVKKKKKRVRKENKDGTPNMGGRAQWTGNRKHSPPSHHGQQQMKFGRKVQSQINGIGGGVIQNKQKKVSDACFLFPAILYPRIIHDDIIVTYPVNTANSPHLLPNVQSVPFWGSSLGTRSLNNYSGLHCPVIVVLPNCYEYWPSSVISFE